MGIPGFDRERRQKCKRVRTVSVSLLSFSRSFSKHAVEDLFHQNAARVTPHSAGSIRGVASQRKLTNQTTIQNMKKIIAPCLAVAALVLLSACASDAPKTSSSTTTTDQSTTYHSPSTTTTTTDTQSK
jgi:hypothetical protein